MSKTTTRLGKMSWLAPAFLAAALALGGMLAIAPLANADPTAGAAPAAASATAGSVRISVTRVRATGEAQAGTPADIDSKLEKLQIPRLRLAYAKYAQDQVVEKTLPFGETLTLPVDAARGAGAGRYEIVPVRAGKDAGRLVLRVKEIAPASSEPCLELESEVQAGRLNLWFCDATIDGGTMLFFVRAEVVGR